MRVAARAADTMATDAELLAGAAVAAGARRGIDACLHAMLTVRPARRVRALGGPTRDVLARVAVDAGGLGVAGRAEPRIGARLLGVTGFEAGAMKAREAHVAEGQLPRQGGDGPFAVARGALPIGVAARAEVARARRAHAVLAEEVSVVNEVIVRRRALVAQIDVTLVAVAHRPLVAVLVAPEARRHLRQDRLRTSLGHVGVAADAVSADGGHVPRVLEEKLRARELRGLPNVRFAVAADAGPIVVRLLMALQADAVARKMQRPGLSRESHAGVAFDAVDALQHVRAMFEGMGRRIAAQAEHAGAGCQRERQQNDQP